MIPARVLGMKDTLEMVQFSSGISEKKSNIVMSVTKIVIIVFIYRKVEVGGIT